MTTTTRSMEFYQKMVADDTDDSDDDILTQTVFSSSSSKKKKKEGEELSQPSLASLTQESTEKASPPPPKPIMTSERVEVMAQEEVKDLKFPVIQDTNRMDQLGWHKAQKQKNQKENTWHPCRLCHPDEGIGLFHVDRKDENKILVRYLGYQSYTAGSYDEINAKEFHPLSEGNREKAFDTYRSHLARHFKGDLVGCRAEELAVRAMWNKVQERENGESSSPDKRLALEDLCSPAKTASPPRTPPAKVVHATYNSDSDDVCRDSDDDDEADLNVKMKAKKEILRDGDVIEYYDPIGVAGNPEWLRRATILGIDPKNRRLPLNLDNGQFLDRSAMIKRVRRRNRCKIEDYSEGTFKETRDYSLRSCGTMEMVALQNMAQRAKKIRQKHQEEIDEFWQGDENAGDQSTSLTTSTSQEGPVRKQSNTATTTKSKEPKWKMHLADLLKSIQEQTKKQRRFTPSMEPEQIETVLKVWEILQGHIDISDRHNAKTVVPALSSKLRISVARLDAVMHGDEKKSLSTANKSEVIAILEEWLKEPTPLELEDTKVAAVETGDSQRKLKTNRRRSCPVPNESLKDGLVGIQEGRRKSMQVPARAASEPSFLPLKRKKQGSAVSLCASMDSHDRTMPQKKQLQSPVGSKPDKKAKIHPVEEIVKMLTAKIDSVKKQLQQQKRFRPHMAVHQLEISLQIWNKAKADDSETEDITELISRLATQLELSERKLDSFLKGDEKRLVGISAQEKITEKLGSWLVESTQKVEQDATLEE